MLKNTDYRLHYSQNNNPKTNPKTWNFKGPFIYVDMRGEGREGRGNKELHCILESYKGGLLQITGPLYHGGCLKLQWCFIIFVR